MNAFIDADYIGPRRDVARSGTSCPRREHHSRLKLHDGDADSTGMGLWAQTMLDEAAGDRDYVVDLAGIFLAALPPWREAIAAAIATQDARALAAAAHRMRGSATHVGAPAVASAAGVIEEAANAGQLDAAIETCESFMLLLDALEHDVRAFILETTNA
jgi:HPt (histidine-containing phosphotransfer) domain-containing protein